MSDQFKAIVLNQEGENFSREVKSLDKSFLKHGDVTVKVDYSDLNFKDGMILKNGGRLVKEYPHIPGIDFSGTVIESDNSKFKEGDEVITITFQCIFIVSDLFFREEKTEHTSHGAGFQRNSFFLFVFMFLAWEKPFPFVHPLRDTQRKKGQAPLDRHQAPQGFDAW